MPLLLPSMSSDGSCNAVCGEVAPELAQPRLHVVPGERRLLRRPRPAIDRLHDPVLEIGGDALVQPAVLPVRIGDQIARPAVRQLVRDQPDQAAVAGEEGRRQEGERRVLHAPVGKARRQHDHVVAAPAIGPVEPLGRLHHPLGIDQLVRRTVQHRRLGPYPGPPAERPEGEVAGCNRDQIGRDRMGHAEAPGAAAGSGGNTVRGQPLARHHHLQRHRRNDPRLPGLADAGAVLGRDPGPVEDRLALAEQKGMRLARGLRRRQPLQRLGVGSGAVTDRDPPGRADPDGQRLAAGRVVRAEREGQGAAARAGNRLDLQPLAVEDDLLRSRRRLDVERRRAGHAPRLEIGGEVERDMGDPRDLRAGIGLDVARVRSGQDRRDGGGRAAAGRGGGHAGGNAERGEEKQETHGDLSETRNRAVPA